MRRHRLAALLAVLAVAGCAARNGPEVPGPAPSTSAGRADLAALVVHDGDTVEASGPIVQVPGRPPRFCAPAPVPAIGYADGKPRTCELGVDLAGLDTGRLGPAGLARLRGTMRGGVLHVTAQGPAAPEPIPSFDWQVPCPAPAGGWHSGRPDEYPLHQLIYDEHPDWYRDLRVTYPDGEPGSATDGPTPRTVFVVEIVTADRAAAERAVRERYQGDVCFVARPGAKSLAGQHRDMAEVQAVAEPLMNDRTSGVYGMRGGDLVEIEMVMLTPELAERLAPVASLIQPSPWLRPVGPGRTE